MASITTIPPELLGHILAHVADNLQSDIAAVRLVCKQFNEVAAPVRVRNWSDDRTSSHTTINPTDIRMVGIDRFALELLRHPELRSQVRSLKFLRLMSWEFNGYEKPHHQDEPWGRFMCRAARKNYTLLAKAEEEELPHLASSTSLCEQIPHFRDEALAILVISWATNLESLSLTFGSFHFHMPDDILVSHFAKHVAQQFLSKDGWANRHLPFGKLRHLEFHVRCNRELFDLELELGENLKFLVPFLHLPRLKSLKCSGLRTKCEYRAWWNNTKESQLMPFPDRTSSIESLELIGPCFSTVGLGRFLQAFKTLKSLKVRVDGRYPQTTQITQITRGPTSDGYLPRVLIEHASSLEELDLPMNQQPNAIEEEPRDMIGFELYGLRPNERLVNTHELEECYRKLTHVRKLGIPAYFRTWSDINTCHSAQPLTPSRLPESVEHLTLYTSDLDEEGDQNPEIRKVPAADVLDILWQAGEKGWLSQLKSMCCTNVMWGLDQEHGFAMAEARGVKLVDSDDCSEEDLSEDTDLCDNIQDGWFEYEC